MRNLFVIVVLFFVFSSLNAQWTQEWSSDNFSGMAVSGWVSLVQNGDEWEERLYVVDSLNFRIMTEGFSSTVAYEYSFDSGEQLAGGQIYSLGVDLTGDNITEFYVLAYRGTTYYRQSFKIIDITNGDVLFNKDDATHSYTYPTIWDADNDNTLECTFSAYEYPNYQNYKVQIYNTNVSLTGVDRSVILPRFELLQNFPNPFNPSTNISFKVDKPTRVTVRIFDMKGEMVKVLYDQETPAGQHNLQWDASNSSGKKVSTGAYFYEVITPNQRQTKKMLFIK